MKYNSEKLQPLPNSLPETFAESVEQVIAFILAELDRQITQNQLYYHNREHIKGVQQRAEQIFRTIRPAWEVTLEQETAKNYLERMKLLLDLSAIAHDTIQIFIPKTEPHTPRRREAGVSEQATIEYVFDCIHHLNQQLQEKNPQHPARFIESDFQIIKEAIAATICAYDPDEQAIYQPELDNADRSLSYVARIIALADIGALGLNGIEDYNHEGSLLFLEENPDIVPLIRNHQLPSLKTEQPELYENLRQRLLRRTRFQVNFARSRLARYEQELVGFPIDAIPILREEVFQYLRPSTIRELEAMTPMNEATPLEVLIAFFQFEKISIKDLSQFSDVCSIAKGSPEL